MSDPVDAPPPAPASGPTPGSPDKRKKKKKVRSAWISFGGRIVAQIIGAAASVGLGLFFIHRSQQAAVAPVQTSAVARADSTRPAGEIALAVLPLSNYSGDERHDYFADGMTEALTAELAQIRGLHVISRTSTMRYKDARISVPQVAQELGVDFVVEGSVVRADDRVRVTAQLIDAKADEHVWARSYDRRIRDVLALQAEVAGAIATELKGTLASARGGVRRAVDPAVYDLYLRGRQAWSLRTPEGFATAIKYFSDATARDPEFALAYAGIADSYILRPVTSLADGSRENVAKAKAAALRAIELDDGLAEAHTALGAVYFFGERDLAAAEKEFRRALELNEHHPSAHQWYAIALSESGRHEEAQRHADEAVKQDPLNGTMHQAFGLVRYYARDYEAAIAAQRRALQLNAQLPLARVVLAKSLILQGKPRDAIAACEEAPKPRTADVDLMLAIAHARSGNRAAADAVFKDLAARNPRAPVVLAQWFAANGNYDAAFAELRQTNSAALPAVLRVDPLFDGLRADRRWPG